MKIPKKVPKVWFYLGKKYRLVEEIKDGDRDLIVSKFHTPSGWEYEIKDRVVILQRIKLEKEYS